jgi:hypothetical protein
VRIRKDPGVPNGVEIGIYRFVEGGAEADSIEAAACPHLPYSRERQTDSRLRRGIVETRPVGQLRPAEQRFLVAHSGLSL